MSGPTRLASLLLALAGLLLAFTPDVASATSAATAASGPPSPVSFQVSLTFVNAPDHPACLPQTPCEAVGSFTGAASPLCSAGSATDVYVFPGGQRNRTYVCNDGSGTISMQVQYRKFYPGPVPDTFLITGTWEVVGGTGVFTHLTGVGTVQSIFTPGVDGTLAESNQGNVVLAL